MTHAELEAEADAILKQDIAENGFDGRILLDDHLRYRRTREVYNTTGQPRENIRPGVFSRGAKPAKEYK